MTDVVPGSLGSNPISLTAVGNRVFFVAFSGPGDTPALWVSNGTAAGTFRLREFANARFSPPRLLTAAGNRLFFLDTRGFGPSWTPAVKAAAVAGAASAPLVPERTDPAAKAAPCVASATRLCLNGGRFAVEVAWKDFSGNTGTGKAAGLTGDTGSFWFFDDDNVELVLKVLDGRPVNGKFWVFYGALSSVEYTITVTDIETGTARTYKNPSGRLASVGDTGAF